MDKQCTKCKAMLPATQEYFYYDKSHKDGLRSRCKKCCNKTNWEYLQENKKKCLEWRNKWQRDWHRKNPEKAREYQIRSKYGLTKKQLRQMYLDQNGQCKICKIPVSYDKMNIDHNHKTGKIRKLLCRRCNHFIGYMEKTPQLTSKALEYLRNEQ